MRIIGGEFRGRRLASPRGRDVRPTSDRVREAVFNILGDLHGATVLDLFAGTGAMGLEALSRGAGSATFVEIDRAAVEVVRRNIDATISADRHRASIIHSDAVKALRRLCEDGAGHYDLVFLDPPYERAEELLSALDECLGDVVGPHSRIVLELATRHDSLVEPTASRFGATVATHRRYGDTTIAVLDVDVG